MGMKELDRHLAGATEGCTLATRMRFARSKSGLSVKDACAAIGLSEGHFRKIERGGVRMVQDALTLQKAGKAFGVSELWLYAGSIAGERFVPEGYRPENAA